MDELNIPIALHCHVLVKLVEATGETEEREFLLVTAKEADFQSGLLDENTPLAQSLLGHRAGEIIPYDLGGLKEVLVLKVKPAKEDVSRESADKRRAAVRKAEAQSEITNQMIFSTASGSKWGDYEVNMDQLLGTDEKKNEKEKD
jgi:hypothetical protein